MMKYERLTTKGKDGKWTVLVNDNDRLIEDIQNIVDRLAELEDKIEQGTLIELPVKVGDTVYCVYAATGIQEWEVSGIEILKNTILFLLGHTGTEDYNSAFLSEVGRYLFFTREEAEKRREEAENRLKELQG